MENEKIRILRMVQEGKLSADEAAELLEALDLNEEPEKEQNSEQSGRNDGKATVLRIEITDLRSGEIIRDLKFPLSIARKLTGIIPPSLFGNIDMELPGGIDLKQIVKDIDSPYPAVLFDRDEKDQHVRVFTD